LKRRGEERRGEERSCVYNYFLVWKPEGKRTLGRNSHKDEDNITMDLQKVGCGSMGRIELAMERDMWWALVNAVQKFCFP